MLSNTAKYGDVQQGVQCKCAGNVYQDAQSKHLVMLSCITAKFGDVQQGVEYKCASNVYQDAQRVQEGY